MFNQWIQRQAVYAVLCLTTLSASAQPEYRGLRIGQASKADVIAKLGVSPVRTGHADDLRYPVTGSDTLTDRLFFRNDRLVLVTAASGDTKYPDRKTIEETLGPPEAQVLFETQLYLDYTEHGLKFICSADGKTTGIISFVPRKRRVPADCANVSIDLRRSVSNQGAVQEFGSSIKVGTAQRSITPTDFNDLLADGRGRQLGLAEDLFARVAVFERDGRTVVFVGLDVFGLGPWDIFRLRTALAKSGFPNVVVAMSHTHANVDTIGFYGYYPKKYAGYIVSQTEAAVVAAAGNLQNVAQLRTGTTEMPLHGGRVADLIRNGRDPGLVDPVVSVLQAVDKDGRSVVNVVNLACHPEVIRLEQTRELSPDFVGSLCTEVTRQLGGQTVFLNGALGGMLTPDTRFRTSAAAAKMGTRLAAFVRTAAQNAVPCQSDALVFRTQTVELPVDGESVARFLEKPPEPIEMRNGRIRTDVNLVQVGDAQFLTVPGELLPDIGFEVMQQMSGRIRAVVSLANGELGYLVPAFDFRDGEYEERTGPGREAADIVRRAALKLVRQPLRTE